MYNQKVEIALLLFLLNNSVFLALAKPPIRSVVFKYG